MIVVFDPAAVEPIRGLPKDRIVFLVTKATSILSSFSQKTPNVKRLQGSPLYRLRIGDYRVMFKAEGQRITVMKIVDRKDAYK